MNMTKVSGPYYCKDVAAGNPVLGGHPSIYYLAEFPKIDKNHKWSGKSFMPSIGSKVRVAMNNLGVGTIRAYFVECGWIGVHVTPDDGQRPDWHIKQNGDRNEYLVFGSEIEVAP